MHNPDGSKEFLDSGEKVREVNLLIDLNNKNQEHAKTSSKTHSTNQK